LSVSGMSYISRPSLSLFMNIPNETIRGIYYQAGNGSVAIYVVAGNSLYKINEDQTKTRIGTIPGSKFCTFASTIYHIAIAADGRLFLYDGTSLIEVTIPDNLLVSDVTSLDNYFIVGIESTNKFYWIEPGQIIIDGLSFASAERNPDDIVTMISIGDELWAIGQNTVEIFTDSGDSNAPFVRLAGRVYQTGCVDKHSIVKCNKETLPCLIWVTPTREVVLAQGVPTKISNESIEELLKRATSFNAWTFRTNRHDFYVLTTDNETIVYDLNAGSWYVWSSYQSNTWNAYAGIQINADIYAIEPNSGDLYKVVNTAVDKTQDYIVCEVGGFLPNATNDSVVCNSITLFLNYGYSTDYTSAPVVELRWSDNGGVSWTEYYQGSVGSKGSYDKSVRYRSLGSFNRPGRYIELRFSEISSFRLDGATLNDSA
jgi:Phage stabilisation protein